MESFTAVEFFFVFFVCVLFLVVVRAWSLVCCFWLWLELGVLCCIVVHVSRFALRVFVLSKLTMAFRSAMVSSTKHVYGKFANLCAR